MIKSNLWSINENSVSLNKNALFRSYLNLPSNVVVGEFEVKILHYRNGSLLSKEKNTINVSKSGFSAEIYNIAENYSTLYGIFAVLLAVLIGFAVAMLGLIYAIHSQDIYLGILIMVGGIASMHMGLPS